MEAIRRRVTLEVLALRDTELLRENVERNSGNSMAPHLHFHVMDGPLLLASNGLPYVVDSFAVTGRSAGTDAFNEAEQEGTVLEVTPVDPAERITQAMPLDQYVVGFD